MHMLIAAVMLVVGMAATATPADACSIRGRWCDYPAWAANAFEGRGGRVNLNSGPVLPEIGTRGYGAELYYGPPAAYYDAPSVYVGPSYSYAPRRYEYRYETW
jgi:hypothetical protein